jgi:ATP-binding cassette subfamily F protein 3
MREALAEALNDFDGAIVLVSHDRSLLGLVCDTFWRVADGRVEPFDGDLDDYARWLRQRRGQDAEPGLVPKPAATSPAAPAPVLTGQQRRRLAAERRERERPLRRRLDAIEARLAAIAAEAAALDARLLDPDAVAALTGSELGALAKRQGELRSERTALEDEWLEVSGELEELERA